MAHANKKRERQPWKKGNPSANRADAKYKVSEQSRLDFLVVKVTGGAQLSVADLHGLGPMELVWLGRHLEWLLSGSTPGTTSHDNAQISIGHVREFVPDAPDAPKQTGSSLSSSPFVDYALSKMDFGLGPDLTKQLSLPGMGSEHHHGAVTKTWTEADMMAEERTSMLPGPTVATVGVSTTPPSVSAGVRQLSDWEQAVATRYFPPWFDTSFVTIYQTLEIGRAWFRARVGVPRAYFVGGNFRTGSVKNEKTPLEYFLHELYHVFQRSLDRPIEREFFGNRRAVKDKYYEYDKSIAASELLDHFLRVNFESQAEMFGDAASDAQTSGSAGRLAPVLDYIRNLPPESTVNALMHVDLPARARDQIPDPRTP